MKKDTENPIGRFLCSLVVAILVLDLGTGAVPAFGATMVTLPANDGHAVSSTFNRACEETMPGTSSGERTLVLRQDLDGYHGVRDTWIDIVEWGTPPQYSMNYGQNGSLYVMRDATTPLLGFDLSALPANSAVVSAVLSLYNKSGAYWDCVTPGTTPRRVKIYRLLRDWHEGNQTGAQVSSTPGAFGATGDYAFAFYGGSGNVPWAVRGLAAGTDYAAVEDAYADILNAGRYELDVTSLVRRWVRQEEPNFGAVLRDYSGYQAGACDLREFASSQEADPDLRPTLTVTYNPDVPFADAGPDQVRYDWYGGAVTLNGSGSHDRAGGNDASLTFAWRVAEAAYGSALGGMVLSPGKVISFTPDRSGEWEIELTVTNNLGESATDLVHLNLLGVPAGHPRIYLTPAKLATLRSRAVPGNLRWTQLQGEAAAEGGEMHAKALVSLITGETSYCTSALADAMSALNETGEWASKVGDCALVFDWCYGQMSPTEKTTFVNALNAEADKPGLADYDGGWGNHEPGFAYSEALLGLATAGDNTRAPEWLDHFRHARFQSLELPSLNRIAAGGGWPEGMVYDWIVNVARVKTLEAWRTATGENLFESSPWFRERLEFLLLHRWPGLALYYGYDYYYHPYASTGDAERNRAPLSNYERIMGLILIERYPDESAARRLQAYLSAPPADHSMDFLSQEEFLWYNPEQPSELPQNIAHFAAGIGQILMRSGWPGGAADADAGATYLTFQCGDHFSYHQHYEQNSFTLFKYGDLLVDSGVYSGNGTSYHDVNYYVRTIAHNTLAVYNPAEDFSEARPEAVSNDGGQRTFALASRSPMTVEYWDQNAHHYETGDMLRYEQTPEYTYALGDATAAYNNPTYNQEEGDGLTGNVAKVSRFQRELVYLRPGGDSAGDYVVLFDRVGVTQSLFSGANTKLLFHVLNEPHVNGSATVVSPGETLYRWADAADTVSGEGKLFLKVLLPATRNIRKVGGRGVKSFWVFDANYDWQWDANEPQPRPVSDYESIPYGEWRLELEPGDTALEHNFLTVLHPAASTAAAMPATSLITGSGVSGAHIADTLQARVVLFSSDPAGAPPAGTITYSAPSADATLHVLFDLEPGKTYRLGTVPRGSVVDITLTPDAAGSYQVSLQGVVRFTMSGGTNRPPVAVNDTATTDEDSAVTIAVLVNDSDPDGDPLTLQTVGTAGHGTAVKSGASVVYTPAANWNGTDTFTYVASDGKGGSATATVTVTVTPVNDAPTDITLSNQHIVVGQPPGSQIGAFAAVDVDAGDTFTYQLVRGAGSRDNASFQIEGNLLLSRVVLRPAGKTYSIRVRVTDQGGLSMEKVFKITVDRRP